jgi:aspartyl-tRNA(Asn)/glutamyl-tRNA(Gln) amidotransferase subunit C
MISKEEVEHIAKLARLELTKNEVEKMQKDLSAILDYFALLNKAPKLEKNIEETRNGLEAMRADEVKERDAVLTEKIIALSPDKKDDYFKVKTIL